MVKYPFWVHKLLHYTIQHENGRHIDFRQKSVSPGQIQLTTARRFSAYMSSRALATTTTSSLHYVDILLTHTRMDGWMDGWMDCTSKAEKSIINFIIKTRLYMQMLRQLTYARKIRLIRCFIVIVKRGANKINCSGRCPLKDAHRQQCTVNDERHGLTKRGVGRSFVRNLGTKLLVAWIGFLLCFFVTNSSHALQTVGTPFTTAFTNSQTFFPDFSYLLILYRPCCVPECSQGHQLRGLHMLLNFTTSDRGYFVNFFSSTISLQIAEISNILLLKNYDLHSDDTIVNHQLLDK